MIHYSFHKRIQHIHCWWSNLNSVVHQAVVQSPFPSSVIALSSLNSFISTFPDRFPAIHLGAHHTQLLQISTIVALYHQVLHRSEWRKNQLRFWCATQYNILLTTEVSNANVFVSQVSWASSDITIWKLFFLYSPCFKLSGDNTSN